MKKCRLLLTFLVSLFTIMHVYAYTERNLLQQRMDIMSLKEAVVMNQKWVPYPTYMDREGWQQLIGDKKEQYIKNGEAMLSYPWKVMKATDFMEYERSGAIVDRCFEDNNAALMKLIMAELAEGKGRFMDQIINGVYLYCEMTSWVHTAHVKLQKSGRSLPDYRDKVIELTSCDMGAVLSWTYYFFHNEFDKVDPVIALRLKKEIKERVMDVYLTDDHFWWMAFNWKPGAIINNWNPWCNANVLQCFMLLEDDKEILAKAVYRTMQSVDKYINYVHADGACEEGPSYWGHSAGKLYDYLQLLCDATGGKLSFFKEPIVRNMGEYISRSYVGNGWVVNFADASAKGGGDAALIYRYGKAVNSAEMMGYAAYLDKMSAKPQLYFSRDIYQTLQTVRFQKEMSQCAPKHEVASATWYPETQFCYMKDKGGFFLAAKAGHNNESHNHNDVGTFSLYLKTMPLFIDAGVGTYTRQTFSKDRYTIWTMQSDYHNLPLINGIAQKDGAEYKATQVAFDAKKRLFTANIANAYPKEAKVENWVRSYTLRNGKVTINDRFKLKNAIKNNEVHFLTWGKVDISVLGKIKIQVADQSVEMLYDKNTFTVHINSIPLTDVRLTNVWGKEVYRISLLAKKIEQKGNYKFEILNTKK